MPEKGVGRLLAGSHGLLAICLALALPLRAGLADERATIAATRLHLRSGPGIEFPSVQLLERGVTVQVLERQNGWARVVYDDQSGFLCDRPGYLQCAAPPAATPAEESRRIAAKIATAKEQMQQYDRQEQDLVTSLDEIDRSLHTARQETDCLETQLQDLEKARAQNSVHLQALAVQLRQSEQLAGQRLTALYKLSRIGWLPLVASANSLSDTVTRFHGLSRILSQDEVCLTRMAADQQEMERLSETHARQLSESQRLRELLAARIASMATESQRRQELLAKLRSQRELNQADLTALEAAAAALEEKIQRLDETPSPAASAGRSSFSRRRGGLSMPVRGAVVTRFGVAGTQGRQPASIHNGIDIRAERGEPIHAVESGTVLFAEWLKGYGNLLIIDHGESYYTIYGHLEEFFKEKHAAVEAGEVIATVGDMGTSDGPTLYFEVRHHGKPLDPLEWIRRG